MRQSFFALLLLVFLVGCTETTGLSKTCPLPEPCYLDKAGNVVLVPAEYNLQGECKIGITACDEDINIICTGYVIPTEEICDSLDNDCDGQTDEGYDQDGDGVTTCAGDCNDNDKYISPNSNEVCNNIDDNCNDSVDENVFKQCWTGGAAVFGGLSTCKYGTSTCTAGRWSYCKDEILPMEEVCDSLDNDCDGEIDEKVTNSCGISSVGACTMGDKICSGNEQLCVDAVYPSGEVCDGIDNDCDGIVDNGLYRPCSTVCGQGFETCSASEWVNCSAPIPTPELCDRVDNDCDGDIDEGCSCLQGEASVCRNNIVDSQGQAVTCGYGITICDITGTWGPCQFFGTEEEVCNNWDDDCDGAVDGITKACGDPTLAGIGQCRLGTEECIAGSWSSCQGAVAPQAEICDQLDNDCDGQIDENLNGHDKVDMVFAIDISGSMCSIINALTQGIATYVSNFVGTDHRFGIVAIPGPYVSYQPTPAQVRTMPSLVDVQTFQNVLSSITCNGAGAEPTWDVAQMLLQSADPLMIGWRRDAYPYIIVVTDEPAQSWLGLSQPQISSLSTNCQLGKCQMGDRVEFYVITRARDFPQWNNITYNEADRLIDIYPASSSRYTQFFRNIFSNVCI